MVDRQTAPSPRLIPAQAVETSSRVEPPVFEAEAEAEPEPEAEVAPLPVFVTGPLAPEPSLLNDHERKRMDLAMSGLSRFRPVNEPQRPAPRAEVDPLSSVSAADWSGMDGLGESIAPLARTEPVVVARPRREPVATSSPAPAPASTHDHDPASIPTTDPIKGWVTADRLFSDFGD